MAKHIQRQLQRLKEGILHLGALSQTGIADAVTGLMRHDEVRARKALAGYALIERSAQEVEEECLKTFALYQPAASDLRLVVSVLKIASELRRIGELARNIGKRAVYFSAGQVEEICVDFRPMADHAQKMVKASLKALVNSDSTMAHQVVIRRFKISHRSAGLASAVVRVE
jgi:phosphate transport system protein